MTDVRIWIVFILAVGTVTNANNFRVLIFVFLKQFLNGSTFPFVASKFGQIFFSFSFFFRLMKLIVKKSQLYVEEGEWQSILEFLMQIDTTRD